MVDPLDGTINFLYGHPPWCVSVAVEDASGGLAGVVLDPPSGELFAAARGEGATLNGAPISVRPPTTSPRPRRHRLRLRRRAPRAAGGGHHARALPRVRDIRRGGAAALDLAYVAAGRLDGYFERGLKPWDWAAGRLLVEEAGEAVRELPGEPTGMVAAERVVDELDELVS